MKFRPLRDQILVKPFARQDSLIIHVVTNKRMHRGEVMAVGPGRDMGHKIVRGPDGKTTEYNFNKPIRPLDVKVGDIVNYGDTPLQFQEHIEDGVKYLILQEGDVAFVEVPDDEEGGYEVLSIGRKA